MIIEMLLRKVQKQVKSYYRKNFWYSGFASGITRHEISNRNKGVPLVLKRKGRKTRRM